MLTQGPDTDPREPPDSDEQAEEILPLRHRVGLWCALFPGCGVLIICLSFASAVPFLRRRERAPPHRRPA